MSFTQADRRLGTWSALLIVAFGIIYLITGIIGAVSKGGFWPPKQVDPFLAIMEAIIVAMAPCMIILFVAIHRWAPESKKIFGLVALIFMVLCAGLTSTIQFIRLTVLRRVESSGNPLLHPDLLLLPDLLAWDLFYGLSMAFAAAVFSGSKMERTVRTAMIVSASLCLIGFLGPASGDLRLQAFAIFGYTLGFMVVCYFLFKLFKWHRA